MTSPVIIRQEISSFIALCVNRGNELLNHGHLRLYVFFFLFFSLEQHIKQLNSNYVSF